MELLYVSVTTISSIPVYTKRQYHYQHSDLLDTASATVAGLAAYIKGLGQFNTRGNGESWNTVVNNLKTQIENWAWYVSLRASSPSLKQIQFKITSSNIAMHRNSCANFNVIGGCLLLSHYLYWPIADSEILGHEFPPARISMVAPLTPFGTTNHFHSALHQPQVGVGIPNGKHLHVHHSHHLQRRHYRNQQAPSHVSSNDRLEHQQATKWQMHSPVTISLQIYVQQNLMDQEIQHMNRSITVARQLLYSEAQIPKN